MRTSLHWAVQAVLRSCLIVFVVGGMTSTIDAQVKAAALQGNASCGAMTPDNANNNVDASAPFDEDHGVTSTIYSLKDRDTDDLGYGKWVGIVHRTDGNGNASSKIFPPLRPGQYGCLLFIQYYDRVTASISSAAFLMLKGAKIPSRLMRSAICEHPAVPHPPKTPPHIEPDADNCQTGSRVTVTILSTNEIPLTIEYTVTTKGTEEDFFSALQSDSRSVRQFGPNGIRSLAKELAYAGPWFPCAAAGCCRVF